MSLYTIKKVPSYEVDKLIRFIDQYWKKGHALTKSKVLLDFQHYNSKENCYNFIVAENNKTKEYDALMGFISTCQYDDNLTENGDYWGAIWKCREDINNSEINSVAFYVWKSIFREPHFHSYAAIGISNIAKRIYEVSKIPVDYLRHYYIANENLWTFNIGKNLIKGNPAYNQSSELKIIDIENLQEGVVKAYYRPLKSIKYFINRYKRHPIYKYFFLGVYNDNILLAIFSVRKIAVNNSCVLRIVDVLGQLDMVGNIYEAVQSVLKMENAEYIDIMNFGINEQVFNAIGFRQLDIESDEIIIPNYFEPFEQRNVKVEMGYKANFPYVVFKGDSDQDRPNEL